MRRPQEPTIRRPTTVSNRYVLHIGLDATPWVDDDQGRPQPLSRDDDPSQWRQAAYRDVPILIQFDDGKTRWPDTGGELCTSSASKPELVLSMLAALDVHAPP